MKRITAVILAGGGLPDEFKNTVLARTRALVPVHGTPMVVRVIKALRQSPSVGDIVLVMEPEFVTAELRGQVDAVRPAGAKLLQSLESGLMDRADEVLVMPADCPFMTSEAIEHFLSEVRSHPADLFYGYLSQEDSQRKYPGLAHTWAHLYEGRFCGTGLVVMKPSVLRGARALMAQAVAARKSPWRIVGLLGWRFIFRFLTRQLRVAEAESRVAALLGVPVRAIRTPFAEAGFNVDTRAQLTFAERTSEGLLARAAENFNNP